MFPGEDQCFFQGRPAEGRQTRQKGLSVSGPKEFLVKENEDPAVTRGSDETAGALSEPYGCHWQHQ